MARDVGEPIFADSLFKFATRRAPGGRRSRLDEDRALQARDFAVAPEHRKQTAATIAADGKSIHRASRQRRQTMPILSNVLLSMHGTKLSITATDLEVELVAETDVKGDGRGEITVPGRRPADSFPPRRP